MSAKHEWLNLLEVSGPFLAVPVLREVFPQGLEELDSSRAKRLHSAYEEWRDAVDGDDADRDKLHAAWIDEVLRTALEADDELLKAGKDVPASIVELPEHDTAIAPELVFVDPTHGAAVLAPVHVFPPDTDLSASMKFGGLSCSPGDRMAFHLRALNVPFGIVTNGERWMLVHAPTGEVATFASWYARIWGQEPATLRSFTSLLGVRRFFAPAQDRLPALFERSLKHQDEVTDALGDQVRRAIEVLVQALDRADQDRNRELLRDVKPQELYEAGLTVMMRLVFLLAAEERGLLLLGEPRYDSFYAVSTLRMQLRAESDEILERRRASWSRLLAVFRAVFSGIDHPTLRLPAMGGSLFDPDRFPFLEGRLKGTSWRQHRAEPLPIDDRTVLLLLEAIQTFEGRTLSYRALDVEQIGHVYEGLLERTVSRVEDVTLELEAGAQAKDARVTLGELESARLDGQAAVTSLLVERSKRSESAIKNALGAEVEPQQDARLLSACRGDVKLRDRLAPYVRLMRTDPWGYPLVHPKGAFVVVLGADRRETGTHYTPKSLTERIVEETLTPLVYDGPAKGAPRAEWKLKTPEQLLDLKVCDPAMGSGAFLVQACRFLSARLVEAWAIEEAAGRVVDLTGQVHEPRTSVECMPPSVEARAENARRIVAERCLYGVDLNPLAVELAKLSLWLVTLSKGRPFGFLDHNLRRGDSLLGISRLEQLTELSMAPKEQTQGRLFGRTVRQSVEEALAIRLQLREMPIRDIRDVEAMASLDAAARAKVTTSESIADAFMGLVFATESAQDLERRLATLGPDADGAVQGNATALRSLERFADDSLREGFLHERKGLPFHWPLEFPEVFLREHPGFDAFVGNPPFLGNRLWKGTQGPSLQRIVQLVLGVAPGKIDLSVAFHRRAAELLRVDGGYGLLATNNIAEGSAVAVGLEQIAGQGDFYFTRKGLPWPGSASTVVAIVCFAKGQWSGQRLCDGVACERIGPRLEPEVADGWEPKPLRDAVFAFEGVNNSKGLAFVVTDQHPWFDRLKSERNSLLRPYVTGDDITSGALTRLERWALDIADMSLEAVAKHWPVAHAFLTEVVEPTRTPQALKSYKGLIDRWWQFWNHRAEQMRRLRKQSEFIAFCKAAKYPVCMLAPTEWLYTNKVILVENARPDLLAICLSSPFRDWVSRFSLQSLGGDNNTLSLSITEAFSTFPQPIATTSESGIDAAAKFQEVLTSWSTENRKGMTDAMNAVNSPAATEDAIQELRQLLEKIDGAVKAAYGWTDIDLSHDFHIEVDAEGAPVNRHGTSAAARGRVLAALLKLNRDRHEQERSRPPASTKRAAPVADGDFALTSPESTSKTKAASPAQKAKTRRTSR
ncbi:MAG: DNA methyltransferase [Polyangiaceae bacterium]|nr:DNA methyltransferase [Polyangiaceae bacterium]